VHAEHRLAGEEVEEAILEHAPRAALALLGGLEDDVQDAGPAWGRAPDSSIAVWPSCPQACILPKTLLAQGLPLLSLMGSASMSARRPMRRVPVPTLSVPTTPVTPSPRCTS
jgi:hypothetical protein